MNGWRWKKWFLHAWTRWQMAAGPLFQAFSTPKIREIRKKSGLSVIFEGFGPREWSQTLRHVIFIDSAPLNASKSRSGTRFWRIIVICKICNLSCFSSFSGKLSLPPPTHELREYFIVRHSIPPISFRSLQKIISSSILGWFFSFVFLHRAYIL